MNLSASSDRFSENVGIIPIIVPELELSNIERQVFLADLVVGADNATLEDAPKAFNRIGVDRTDDIVAFLVADRTVLVVSLKAAIAGMFVCGEKANLCRDDFADEAFKGFRADVLDHAGDHVAFALNRANDNELVGSLPANAAAFLIPMAVFVLPADIGFVNFDNAHELAELLIYQSGADTVAHAPCGPVRAGADDTVNLHGRHALLAGQHHMNDAEPSAERIVGVLKNGADDMREAVAAIGCAGVALPFEGHCADRMNHISATARAFNAKRPTVAH